MTPSPPRRIGRHHQPNAVKLVSATLASLVFIAACSTASDDIDGVFVDVAEIATFGTIAELVEASSVIMEGEVVSVVRGRVSVVPELEDFAGTQMLDVTIVSIDQLAAEAAEDTLRERGILYVPSPLSSAGAVVEGVGKTILGLADCSELIDKIGVTTQRVLAEALSTRRRAGEVARQLAQTRISAARGEPATGGAGAS